MLRYLSVKMRFPLTPHPFGDDEYEYPLVLVLRQIKGLVLFQMYYRRHAKQRTGIRIHIIDLKCTSGSIMDPSSVMCDMINIHHFVFLIYLDKVTFKLFVIVISVIIMLMLFQCGFCSWRYWVFLDSVKLSELKANNHINDVAYVLCTCFHANPALVIIHAISFNCTASKPGTRADDAFVLKRCVHAHG